MKIVYYLDQSLFPLKFDTLDRKVVEHPHHMSTIMLVP